MRKARLILIEQQEQFDSRRLAFRQLGLQAELAKILETARSCIEVSPHEMLLEIGVADFDGAWLIHAAAQLSARFALSWELICTETPILVLRCRNANQAPRYEAMIQHLVELPRFGTLAVPLFGPAACN